MGKSVVISVQETDNSWNITQRRVDRARVRVGTRDGSHLQEMFVALLQTAGAGGLASKINGLTVAAEASYDVDERHTMSLETAKGGKLIVKVLTKNGDNEQRITGEFESGSYGSLKDAIAGLALSLDAPLFSAQIVAL